VEALIDPPPLAVQLNAGCGNGSPELVLCSDGKLLRAIRDNRGRRRRNGGIRGRLFDRHRNRRRGSPTLRVPYCGGDRVRAARCERAVLVDAPLGPIGKNDTPAAGLEDHVYVSAPVPEPATLRLVVVPITGFGDAEAGCSNNGKVVDRKHCSIRYNSPLSIIHRIGVGGASPTPTELIR